MPKKTKKDKLLAEYRRRLSEVSSTPRTGSPVAEKASYELSDVKKVSPIARYTEKAHIELDPTTFSAIKRDLIATLGMVSIMLLFEIGIWRFIG